MVHHPVGRWDVHHISILVFNIHRVMASWNYVVPGRSGCKLPSYVNVSQVDLDIYYGTLLISPTLSLSGALLLACDVVGSLDCFILKP